MTLKFKRTFPVLVLLVAFLAFTVLAFGNQPIIAYTFN